MEDLLFILSIVSVPSVSAVLAAVGCRIAIRQQSPPWWIALAASLVTAILLLAIGYLAEMIVPGSSGKGGSLKEAFMRFVLPTLTVFALVASWLVVWRYRRVRNHDNAASYEGSSGKG
jgi:hypothetical protein